MTALAFSPDGHSLATGSNDGSIRIWDVARRVTVRVIRRVGQFSPLAWDGGERIVFHGNGPDPVLFDLTREQTIAAFDAVGGPSSVYRGPDNKAWVASEYRRVVLLDEERKKTRHFDLSSATKLGWDGNKIVFSADRTTVLAAHAADAVVVRAIADGAPERVIKLPNAKVIRAYAISPDGSRGVVSTTPDGLWVLPTQGGATAEILPWPGDGRRSSVPYIYDLAVGRSLVAAATLNGVFVWDLASKKLAWTRPIPAEPGAPILVGESVDRVTLSPDGSLLATGTASGRVFLYDAATGRLQGELGAKAMWSQDLAFVSPTVVSALAVDARTHVSRVITWSLAEGQLARSDLATDIEAFAADPAGKIVTMRSLTRTDCGDAGFARVVDGIKGARPLICLPGATSMDPWSGKTQLDAGSGLALVPLWINPRAILDVRSGAITKLEGTEPPNDVLQQAILAPGGAHVVGNDTKTIFVWSTKTGKVTARVPVSNVPTALALSRDGLYFAAAVSPFLSGNTFVVTYDVTTGAKVAEAGLSGAGVTSLAFGETRNVIAVAGIAAVRGSFLVLRDGKVAASSVDDADFPSRLIVDPTSTIAATMSQDGGLRIWDMKTATLRGTLAAFDDGEWLIATPSGRYTGTNEVGSRVGWVYTAPLERFGFEQFSSFYRDAESVQKRVAGREQAGGGAVALAPPRPPTVVLAETPPRDRPLDAAVAKIKVRASSPSRVDVVRVYAEGRPVAEKAVCASEAVIDFEVPLVRGLNHVSVVAFDETGFSSNEASVDLAATRADLPNPDIWVVAVGVGKYPGLPARGDGSGLDFQLPGASNDARSIATAFSAMKGVTYANAHVVTLTDHDATPTAIRAAMASLTAMKPGDVGVVFLAGHGLKGEKDGDMVFVTDGVRWNGGGVAAESLAAAGVGWSDIGGALAQAKGRVLVMLDACHSGDVTRTLIVPNESLAEDLVRGQRAGAVVFAAAKGRQFSYEVSSGSDADTRRGLVLEPGTMPLVNPGGTDAHGLFTGALLAALANPETDRNGDGAIQLSEIVDQVSFAVTSATRGKQAPWVAHRELFGDFRIADASRSH